MRLSSSPPKSAPSSASAKVGNGAAVGASAGVAAALLANAACSAGDTAAGAAVAGQVPCTGASVRQPQGGLAWRSASASVSTKGMASGLLLRCSASGTRACHSPPAHCCVQPVPDTAAVWMTSGVSGKKPNALPCTAAGRPRTLTCRLLPSTWMRLLPASAWGCAAWAAAKAGPLKAVEPLSGSFRANSPSSGIHSLRQTSQLACSLISISLVAEASSGILKSGVMVSGTGSSTVPS